MSRASPCSPIFRPSQNVPAAPIIEPSVASSVYNQNNSGFGMYVKLPEKSPYPAFGPGNMRDPRNKPWRVGRFDNGRGKYYRMPFMPVGSEALTPFARMDDGPADLSDPKDKTSPRVGKFTHPSGAPDNHLLTIYSPGPVNHQYTYLPQLDGGIYLLKGGKPMEPFAGKAAGTVTFDKPGDYVVHVTLNDFSEKGGGATGCCWTTAMIKVNVKPGAGAARVTGQQ